MSLPNSDDQLVLLHNPKCSKSRATHGLLEEKGIEFTIRLYLEDPLDRDELADVGRRLGCTAVEFTRTNQAEFEAAGLSSNSPETAIFEAIEKAPILLERPILIRGDRAAIGRPPEDVLALVD